MEKRLPIIRVEAMTTVSPIAINVGFTTEEFNAALLYAARRIALGRESE